MNTQTQSRGTTIIGLTSPAKTDRNKARWIIEHRWILSICLLLVVGIVGWGGVAYAGLPGSAVYAGPHDSRTDFAGPLCDTSFTQVSSPDSSQNVNWLHSISAVSSSDVWVVGTDFQNGVGNSQQTLTEHWNGTAWSIIPSPNPGITNNELFGVAAHAANDAWAVGYSFSAGDSERRTLTEHWNGTAWSVVPSPNPGSNDNELYGVAAFGTGDVWAVGYSYTTGDSARHTLTEHWNGTGWSAVDSPNPGGNDNELAAVSTVSAIDAWAVGRYSNGGSINPTLIEHWNGSTWSIVSSPSPYSGLNQLLGVAAVASNDVWAVGRAAGTLTEHWNGSAWSVVPSPNPDAGSAALLGVSVVASNDVWAAGGGGTGTLTEHWNGSIWTVFASPHPGSNDNAFQGVAAISNNDVWVAGDYSNTGSAYSTLIVHASPCSSSPTPTVPAHATVTSTPTHAPGQFSDVPPGSPFYPYVECLVGRGIIGGYPDGTFRPNNNVTRGQLSKIVSNAAGLSDTQSTRMFQDVPLGSTYQVFIGRLASRGYIGGYACGGPGEPCVAPGNLPYFRPNSNATRGQISKIDSNAAGYSNIPVGQQFEDVPVGSAYYTFTYRLASRSIMSGYPCGGTGEPCIPPDNLPYFRPGKNATRGQTSKIVANTFFPNCQTP